MANWHYFTEDREKIGPVTGKELKELVQQGTITPDTFVEDPQGRTGLAKHVNGLKFPDTETTTPEPFIATPSPFVPAAQTVPVPPVTPSPSADSPFGRILASGNGEGNSAIFLYWAMYIIGAVVCTPILAIVGFNAGDPVCITLTILCPITCLVYGLLYHGSIVVSHIQVGENEIWGKGGGKGFILGDPRLFSFRLAYNQITSVDIAGSTIIVHASGTQYKCYVANPAEIQKIIVNQQRGLYNEQQIQELAAQDHRLPEITLWYQNPKLRSVLSAFWGKDLCLNKYAGKAVL